MKLMELRQKLAILVFIDVSLHDVHKNLSRVLVRSKKNKGEVELLLLELHFC
jgi:hypothetical protein